MPIVYGNRGRVEGNNWVMDTDRDAPSGDISEACGDNAVYRIPLNKISSKPTVGFCFNLPGNPPKYKVTFSGSLVTDLEKGKKFDPSTSYRFEKVEDLGFEWEE